MTVKENDCEEGGACPRYLLHKKLNTWYIKLAPIGHSSEIRWWCTQQELIHTWMFLKTGQCLPLHSVKRDFYCDKLTIHLHVLTAYDNDIKRQCGICYVALKVQHIVTFYGNTVLIITTTWSWTGWWDILIFFTPLVALHPDWMREGLAF